MNEDRLWNQLQQRIAKIVADGTAVRDRVAEAVASAVAESKSAAHSVGDVVRRTAEGAVEGARQATADSARGVLKEVVSGVGDGVARTALAARLAFDEARRRGQGFATRDLERVVGELTDVGAQVVDSFATTVANAGGEVAGQARAIRSHAENVVAQVEPGLRAAIAAVREDPLGLAVDSVRAGSSAVRRATGELFDAVGGLLGEAAKRLRESR